MNNINECKCHCHMDCKNDHPQPCYGSASFSCKHCTQSDHISDDTKKVSDHNGDINKKISENDPKGDP